VVLTRERVSRTSYWWRR